LRSREHDAAAPLAKAGAHRAVEKHLEEHGVVRGRLVDLHLVEGLASVLVDLLFVVDADELVGPAGPLAGDAELALIEDELVAKSQLVDELLEGLPVQALGLGA
jgi:hypothetical protein